MVEIKDLKVGQKFIECHPTNIWFGDWTNVDIEYSEYEIVKVNEKSIVVCEFDKEGNKRRTDNWKHLNKHLFWSKKKTEEQIKKNSSIILKQFDKGIAKYTDLAFEKWYLKAQKRMVELTFQLVEGNKLGYEGLESIKGLIEIENKLLETKLKELK